MQEKIIEDLKKWIDMNIGEKILIDDISERSGYSKWHIQREFSRVTRKSIGQYIRERKLYHAANDLINGDDTMLTISLRYGFESQQTFTRSFTRKYNTPPARFRKKSHSSGG